METAEQAAECIKHLNKSMLDGKTIWVEKNRPSDSTESSSNKESDSKPRDKDRKDRDKDKDGKKRDRDRKRSPGRRSPRRNRSRSPIRGRPGVRSLNTRLGPPVRPVGKIFVPRDRILNPAELRRIEQERLARRRDRITRENEDRRRMESERRQRDVIEREKEKLRIERERLEKEKAELLRLEKERTRMERERIEREKEELKRRLQREEQEMRRPMSSSSAAPIGPGISSMKRPYDSRDAASAADAYWDESRKRQIIGHAVSGDSLAASMASRLGPYDPLQAAVASLDASRAYDSYAAARAAVSTQLSSDTRYSGYGTTTSSTSDSRGRDSSRHASDRDDRGRGGLSSSTSGSSFYRTDLRGVDSRESSRRGNGSGSRGSDDRRDSRPASSVTSMMSSSVSSASVGPGGGMYASSAAPLGPSSLMSHASLSSALGPSSLDRSYGHSSMRRF